MWRTLIRSYDPEARFGRRATPACLAALEITFSGEVPPALLALLCDLDGAIDGQGCAICWCAERIRDENMRMRMSPLYRECYMPFEPLLFFGEVADGQRAGLAIIPGMITQPNVYVWDPRNDSRIWVAASLGHYLLERLRRLAARPAPTLTEATA